MYYIRLNFFSAQPPIPALSLVPTSSHSPASSKREVVGKDLDLGIRNDGSMCIGGGEIRKKSCLGETQPDGMVERRGTGIGVGMVSEVGFLPHLPGK